MYFGEGCVESIGISLHISEMRKYEQVTSKILSGSWIPQILWYDQNQLGMNVYPKIPGWARLYDIGSTYMGVIPILCRKAFGICFPLSLFMVLVTVACSNVEEEAQGLGNAIPALVTEDFFENSWFCLRNPL